MLPLLNHGAPGDAVLLGATGEVRAEAFLAQVYALAEALPEGKFVVNLCETRHGFMLGFAAALVRGQTSLLPPGQGRGDWERVLLQFPGAYLLSDAPTSVATFGAQPFFDLSPFFAIGAASEMQRPQIDGAHIAAILFTSGSTGEPCAHSKTWGQLWQGAANLAAALKWPDHPSFTVVGSVPAQHMFGLEATVLLPWYTGIAVHAQKPLLPADLEIVLQQGARSNWWMTTPLHLRAALRAAGDAALTGLGGVVASTMSLPAALASAAEAAWQVPIMEIYGSTETGALAVRRTATETTWTPLPDVLLWREIEAGEPRFWACGAHVGPAVPLGDELQLNSDGRFLWLGRSSDLIKVGGKRASLSALNQHLINVPGVDDGVYFFPQEINTSAPQRPVAFYVSETLAPQEVLKILRKHIDPLFVPRPLYRVAQLPRNANGKLPQAALGALFLKCKTQRKNQSAVQPGRIAQSSVAKGFTHCLVATNHPALPGHFPGDPLVPGVIILDQVTQAIGARFPQIALGTLRNARFYAPLKPGETFSVQALLRDEQVRFEVRRAVFPYADADANANANANEGESGTLIASGQWSCRSASGVVTVAQ